MENIVQTRLTQKTLPRGIVERRSLFKLLSNNSEKNLILICAPAGYGKTTLVQDFIAKNEYRHSWLNIHPDMDNFYTFVIYLINSLQKLKPEFGKAAISLIEDYRERFQLSKRLNSIVNDIITVFLNEFITHFTEDTYIVLDDLSNLSNSEWQRKTFDALLGNAPPQMHIIITSREQPDFNLNELQVRRNLYKIDSSNLAFKSSEIDELLKTYYDITCSEKDIQILQANLEGWITGIHLVIQNFGNEFPKLRLDKLIILEDIFNYFTDDIFNSLDKEVRNFLLLTSLLDEFTAELCDYVFNAGNSREIIDGLLQKNIFISANSLQTPNNETTYVYHMLFKNFLSSKLKETTNDSAIKEFFKKTAEYYIKQNDLSKAANYSLNAGDHKTALKLIDENFQSYMDSGNFEVMWNWFEKLKDSEIEDSTSLLYDKAQILKFYTGDIEGSLPYLDKAIELSKKNNDPDFLIKAGITKSRNLISIGRINDEIKNLTDIQSYKTKSEGIARHGFLLAFAYYQNGDYDKVLEVLDKGIEELENVMDEDTLKDIRLDYYNLYGHIHLIRGDYSKSISYYEQVVNKSKRVIDKYETYCNLILLYSQSGKFEKALQYLDNAREIAETIAIPIFKITYLLASQSLKFEFGDYEGSIQLLEELNRIASAINHKYYIYLSYSLIGDSYYYLNSISKAEEYFDLAFKYINEESRLEKIQYSYSKALLLKKEKPVEAIETVIKEAYDYYTENKFTYNKTQAAFHLADYYYRIKNYATSLTYLEEAFNMSKEKEYISFLQRDFIDFRYLFDFALANKIQKDFIKIVITSIISQKDIVSISEESSRRMELIISSIYDIKLLTFGKGDLYIRGSMIEESQWSKKKWKLIFIYLMLHSKKKLTKDKIIDVFYPDTAIESADNIFHQIVSKFRNLIKISGTGEAEKKTKGKKKDEAVLNSPLVVYEDKVLEINNDYLFYTDCEEFDSLNKKIPAERNREAKILLLKQAAEMYRGDFMEGNYETWVEELNNRFKTYFITISEELIKLLFEDKNFDEVLEYSDNLLRFDQLNLPAYEFSIRSYENLNKHKQAREKYSRLIKTYEKEYGEKLPADFAKKFAEIM